MKTWKPGWQRPTGWDPAKAGQRGYPKSQEIWEAKREGSRQRALRSHAQGVFTRIKGIPNGWSGRHAELAAMRQETTQDARLAVSRMDTRSEDPRVAEALTFLASVILDRASPATEKLAAARVFLSYTKTRPEARQAVSLESAEDFLTKLLGRA